ncbi:MAG: hypothetical protein KDK23_17155, partial [Leptospiraceae bacterium]|nr:hypothetical protein [Leptospiraceae bacterium]
MRKGRRNVSRSLFILLVLLGAGFATALQAAPDDEKIIEGKRIDPNAPTLSVLMEWTSVKIAEGYVLQIADEQGRLLLDLKDLNDPSVTIKLQPGRYQRRIGIVNKFGKLSFWSPWENFRLVQTKEPRIANLTLGDHTPGQSTRVIVSGENLDEFTEFEASAGKKKVKIWRKQVMSDGKVALDVDTTTLGDEAKVDIKAANPGKDPDTVESALVIDGKEASVNQPSPLRNWSMGDYTWL